MVAPQPRRKTCYCEQRHHRQADCGQRRLVPGGEILHRRNDGGAIIPKEGGGYYYASNSENGSKRDFFELALGEENDLSGGVLTLELDENMDVGKLWFH